MKGGNYSREETIRGNTVVRVEFETHEICINTFCETYLLNDLTGYNFKYEYIINLALLFDFNNDAFSINPSLISMAECRFFFTNSAEGQRLTDSRILEFKNVFKFPLEIVQVSFIFHFFDKNLC